jgi:cysteine desulfurase
MRRIYLDANATTPLLPEVFEAMRPYWMEHYGNASSIHQHGQHARGAVEQSRAAIARLLRCLNSEIVFTSGGTESDNLALFGVLSPESTHGEPAHLITTTIEHHAVLHAAEALEKTGVEVTFLPVTSEGLIEPAALKAALRPNTKLVSIMYANNETGVIQPIQELAAIAHEAGALFHTDAVQVTGKLPLDLSAEGPLKNVDLLTFSGHKMYAPKGIGVLFVRRNVRLAPMMHGGTHERQRRAGTENVACIAGLGKAAELAAAWLNSSAATNPGIPTEDPKTANPGAPEPALSLSKGPDSGTWASRGSATAPAHLNPAEGPTHLTALRDRFEQGILSQIEETGVNGAGALRVSNTSNLYFDHLEAEALVIALDLKGLSVSGGSACQSGAAEPSHVLTAMGLTPARARASIRFSLSRLTTQEEIDEALKIIPAAVARLRELSPAWRRPEPQTV